MSNIVISASSLKRQIETKAFAYGVSPTVSTLIGEYVIELIREASRSTSHLNNSTY